MKMEIETCYGAIVILNSTDKHYPGVYVDFRPNGSNIERPVAVVECDKNDDNPNGTVRVLVYSQKGEQSEDMDYTHKFDIFGETEKKLLEDENKKKSVDSDAILSSLNLPKNYKVMEGDHDTLYVKDQISGKTFEIKVSEIED